MFAASSWLAARLDHRDNNVQLGPARNNDTFEGARVREHRLTCNLKLGADLPNKLANGQMNRRAGGMMGDGQAGRWAGGHPP